MRNALFIGFIGIFVFFLPETGVGLENPVVGDPISRGTLPPTSTRSGLIRSPNPIDRSSNLIVTGNVAGGKHFRGVVPYNAITDFGGRLGTSTLDSFLRRSASAGSYDNYPSRVIPYYSQTGSVTRIRPGSSGIFRPASANVDFQAPDSYLRQALQKQQLLYGPDGRFENLRLRHTPTLKSQLEKLLPPEAKTYPIGERLIDTEEPREPAQQELEQLRIQLKAKSDEAPELRQNLLIKDDSLRLPLEDESYKALLERSKTEPEKLQEQTEQQKQPQPSDIYEQMKQQIDNLRQLVESPPDESSEKKQDGTLVFPDKREDAQEDEASKKTTRTSSRLLKELSNAEISARARAVLGEHKTFASFSKDRFNRHMADGEAHLKQGRYYRAADSYTMASLYKPDDPLPYAGKSHSLFAAGEYMSSALFLARALEIFPEYARFKIDIVAMVGDRDRLETRVADVEQWLKRSGAAELQFLLGYIYYQMGRIDHAKLSIQAAYEKMPQSRAVTALNKAIVGGE